MIDKRYCKQCMITDEMCITDREKWFSYIDNKFIHNIDTFYYSVKFKNDFRIDSKDKAVQKLRRYFKFKYEGLGDYDESGDIYLKEIDKSLVLRPVTFSRFYNTCLSYPDYFDIFLASVVPKSMDGGESVTCEMIVQIRSYMLWMFGVHAAFENSYRFVKELAAYFGLTIDHVQENRVDYCWHSNYLKNPEEFFTPENFYKMRVDRFKNATYVTNKVGTENFEIDYVALGKRSGKVFVRIYQKTREVIEQNYKPWFFKIWKMQGLINDYDLYVYERCFEKKSWFYRFYARLEFYAEYGSHPSYVQMCEKILKEEITIGEDDLIKLCRLLTPELNLVVNVEFQTMRRHSKSYDLLPFKDNGHRGECKRIYDYLDNRKLIMDYLTDSCLKLVERTGDSHKYRRPLCGFWKALRATRCIDVKMTPEQLQLIRSYNRKLNVHSMRKKVINSAVMLGFYLRGINEDSPIQGCAEALLRMNDNDIQEAMRYKNKKRQQLNTDELADVFEDAVTHSFEITRIDTGEIYFNNGLKFWSCQEESKEVKRDYGTGSI